MNKNSSGIDEDYIVLWNKLAFSELEAGSSQSAMEVLFIGECFTVFGQCLTKDGFWTNVCWWTE